MNVSNTNSTVSSNTMIIALQKQVGKKLDNAGFVEQIRKSAELIYDKPLSSKAIIEALQKQNE